MRFETSAVLVLAAALPGSGTILTGVPPPVLQDQCTLCPNGLMPERNLSDVIYPNSDTTCSDLMAEASVISNATTSCSLIRIQGNRLCQCPGEQSLCTICADGQAPDYPNVIAGENGETCDDLDNSVFDRDERCPTIQAKGYYTCGCKTLPEIEGGSCSLCYEKNEFYMDGPFGEKEDYYCSDSAADIYAAGEGSASCIQNQAKAALYCGCESRPPPPEFPSCTLCPGNIDPQLGDRDLEPYYPGITCSTFQELVPILYDTSTCHQIQDIRNYCGCPPPPVCRLCNGNHTVEDPERIIPGDSANRTCEELQEAAAVLTLGSDINSFQTSCQAYRENYAADCCPEAEIEPLTVDFPTAAPSRTTESVNALEKGASSAWRILPPGLGMLLLGAFLLAL
jgi:hypothetical protein